MKKLLLVVLLLILLTGGYVLVQKKPVISPIITPQEQNTDNAQENTGTSEKKTSLFVPYWSLSTDFPTDDSTLIYFGVTPGSAGINKDEAGYLALPRFTEQASGRKSYLTLRMLDSKQNFAILDSQTKQDALIRDVIATAHMNDFEGIILDLEVSALPFDSLIKQISNFNRRFYQAVKKDKLHYGIALYGDTFYRIRPFDVETIARDSDEVLIMAYDMHKSRGNPGPNFPLKGKERYGYDYPTLLGHFTKSVPKEKLTVIFGLFGYDWAVDNERNMVSHGKPLSYLQIRDRYITNCPNSTCTLKRDTLSSESYISYTDDDGQRHLVWFEDMDSVDKKIAYLETQGIRSVSYWAHSYF